MDRLKENFSKKCLTRLAKLLKIGEHQHLKYLTDNASSLHIFTLDELKYNISQRGLFFFNQIIFFQFHNCRSFGCADTQGYGQNRGLDNHDNG